MEMEKGFFLLLLLLLLLVSCAGAQQNIRTFFPSLPSPAFVNPPPPPPTPSLPPTSNSPTPSSSSSSSSSRHDVTVAVLSTAFSSFALSALICFLFLHFSSKKDSLPHPHPLKHPDHKTSLNDNNNSTHRLQPLPPEQKLKHNIIDESGLDAIYWRQFEKENGSIRPQPSSLQSPDHAHAHAAADKRPWLSRKTNNKDREPLIPPGSLDSTSSSLIYDSLDSSTSYDMSPLPPHQPLKDVHTVATPSLPLPLPHLRPPPARHPSSSAAAKPPLHPHPSTTHLSPPPLLQPQLPLPPTRTSSASRLSLDSSAPHPPPSNPFLHLPPGRPAASAAPPQLHEPLITIESIPAPDSSPPHHIGGDIQFTTVPAPPVPPPPKSSPPPPPPPSGAPSPPPPPPGRGGPPPPPGHGGPPPPPPPGGRAGPPPPPPPGGRGGPPPPPPGGRGGPPPPGGRGGPPGPPSLRPPASPGQPSGQTGPRMKPLHWDVMRKLNPDHSMVWDRFKEGGSFRYFPALPSPPLPRRSSIHSFIYALVFWTMKT